MDIEIKGTQVFQKKNKKKFSHFGQKSGKSPYQNIKNNKKIK